MKKGKIDKIMLQLKFDNNKANGKEYKFEAISKNVVYIWKLKNYLLDLYYLVF